MEDLKIITMSIKNKFGALTRVSNVFARRGINIRQLTTAETTTEGISKITILTTDVNADFEQLKKQLNKIEDVVEAVVLDYKNSISKEVLLIRFKYEKSNLELIQEKIFSYSGRIVSFNTHSLVVQIVAGPKKVDRFLKEINGLKDFEILEMSRSGTTSLDRFLGDDE